MDKNESINTNAAKLGFGKWLRHDKSLWSGIIISAIAVVATWVITSHTSPLAYAGTERIYSIFGLIIEFFLSLFFISFPQYLVHQMSVLSSDLKQELKDTESSVKTELEGMVNQLESTKSDINDRMSILEGEVKERIDKLPSLIPFQTDRTVLEAKVNEVMYLEGSSRWIYSKYISRLLSDAFHDFTIKFTDTTSYSDFSSEIMKECKDTVLLTGSMTPYEWLSSLAKDNNNKLAFFNNLIPDIDLNPKNHSKVLSSLTLGVKKRVVCLQPFDFNHLFLFEKAFHTYLLKNDGIDTSFYMWNVSGDAKSEPMEPLKYEYALYDDAFLFKFEKDSKLLTIIKNTADEFQKVKQLILGEGISLKNVDVLKKELILQKKALLESIKQNQFQIPHKYSYLFHDYWTPYIEESHRFGEGARNAIANLLDKFVKSFSNEDLRIVEIGAGDGNKIDLVCDRIGTDNISSYTLVDISGKLISRAKTILRERLEGKKNKNKQNIKPDGKLFDICRDYRDTNQSFSQLFFNKTILILNNSTLFTEPNFPWEKLSEAKRIFITLDLYVSDKNASKQLFDEYLNARELFLSPLKIFDIPIENEIVKGENDQARSLFGNNTEETIEKDGKETLVYTNDSPLYKVYFNLKEYVSKLREQGREVLSIHNNEDSSIIPGVNEYNALFNDFINQPRIVVLSSLKFKKEDDLDTKVQAFFKKRLGDNWKCETETIDNPAGTYLGIYLTKTTSRPQRSSGGRNKSSKRAKKNQESKEMV